MPCVAAGAAELHIHPRGPDGRESLSAVDATVLAVRRACPGTLIGVSTGAWIENDAERTRKCISMWKELPDYASVNLSEPTRRQSWNSFAIAVSASRQGLHPWPMRTVL